MINFLKNIVVFVLTLESRIIIWKYNPKIIAITGNLGKTSAKEAVFSVLSEEVRVRKSEKSFNSEIGIPLTIIGLKNAWRNPFRWLKNILIGLKVILYSPDYPKWLVLEVGADKPGDIEKVSKWLPVDIAVITIIPKEPVHLENFKDRNHLVKEKFYIVDAVKKGGLLIMDHSNLVGFGKQNRDIHLLTYGFETESNIVASDYHINYENKNIDIPLGIFFHLDYKGHTLPVRMNNVFGKQNVFSVMVSILVADAVGVGILNAIEKLKNFKSIPGRFNILLGKNNSIIVDDTYNSSPSALRLAIENINDIRCKGKKIAVLGDMLELGPKEKESHFELGLILPQVFEILILVGKRAKFFGEGALSSKMNKENIYYFKDNSTVSSFLLDILKEGDLVFLKGSQGIRLEKVVSGIVLDEEKIKLVRQETDWLKK